MSLFQDVPGGSNDLGKNDGSLAAEFAGEAQVEAAQVSTDELRRQFDVTQGNISPFMEAGQGLLPGLVEGSSVSGLNDRLAEIMNTGSFGSLVDERMRGVNSSLSAGGLTRSGAALNEAASVPTDLAMAIEDMLYGRQQGIVGSGQNAAAGLGALGYQNSSSIADLNMRAGEATGNAIIQGAQADAQTKSNNMQVGASIAAAAIMFSDERLKENMAPVGKVRDLIVYEWDWKPETRKLAGAEMTIGFSAQEVESKYPHHVVDIVGFKAINYPALLSELEAAA